MCDTYAQRELLVSLYFIPAEPASPPFPFVSSSARLFSPNKRVENIIEPDLSNPVFQVSESISPYVLSFECPKMKVLPFNFSIPSKSAVLLDNHLCNNYMLIVLRKMRV
ncbi:MAG: hypothetical protein PHE33_02950 [Bacteroidales bacterium]|nr:hypothetical protein [Bacteroidales bacterium]